MTYFSSKMNKIGNVKCDSYIVQNKFIVKPGKSPLFELSWANRKSNLNKISGLKSFLLLRNESQNVYLSHTIWNDKEDFLKWLKSQEFIESHKEDIKISTLDILEEHPTVIPYDVLEAFYNFDNYTNDREYEIHYEKYLDHEPIIDNINELLENKISTWRDFDI